MSRTLSFRQSRELLHVDPKTFQKWLQKEGIDPTKQINLADTRERYLTEEQLVMLAKHHGRTLPPFDEQPEPAEPVTLALLVDRLALFEQEIASHLQHLEAQGGQTLQGIADLHQRLTNLERRVPQQDEQQPARQSGRLSSSSVPRAKTEHTSPFTRAPVKKVRKGAKGKKLPRTLIPLHVFAREHGVSAGAADHAAQTGKFPVECGRWLYHSRYITTALDQRGQSEFYLLFHDRQGFQACGACPHAFLG